MPRLFSGKVLTAVLAAAVLDICVMPLFGPVRPVLGYLLAVYAVFFAESGKVKGVALLVGLLRDLAGIEPLGVETLVLLAAAMVLAFIVPKIERESLWTRMGICFVFVFSVFLVRLAFSAFLSGSNAIPASTLVFSLYSALSTALISPFVFWLLQGWFGMRPALRQYELFR